MARQSMPRKSLVRGGNVAIRLNAQRTVSPLLLNSTFHLVAEQAAKGSVQVRRAAVDFQRGRAIVFEGEHFYLVESSKFAGRYYVVIERDGKWTSSSDDARVTDLCVKAIRAAGSLTVAA